MNYKSLCALVALLFATSFLCNARESDDKAKEGYTYKVCIFSAEEGFRPAGSGKADPSTCKNLFETPLSYNGRFVPIPAEAKAFGAIMVSRGGPSEIIVLYEWSDKSGKSQYGCNGPDPRFAVQREDRDEFLKNITKVISNE